MNAAVKNQFTQATICLYGTTWWGERYVVSVEEETAILNTLFILNFSMPIRDVLSS